MLLLLVSGLCHVFGSNVVASDCGPLNPSEITSDGFYYVNTANRLDDGQTYSGWISAYGDMDDNVYITFSEVVRINHIMILEGSESLKTITVYNDYSAYQIGYMYISDTLGSGTYHFWFPDRELNTDRVRIRFTGNGYKYVTVKELMFWGCKMTTPLPTASPTVSPSQMPTNTTPTTEPTMYPSVSPTQVPTNSTLLTQPTTSTDSHDGFIIVIGVAVLLGVVVFFLLITVIFLCFKLRERQMKSKFANETLANGEL